MKTSDKLAMADGKPDVQELSKEYHRSLSNGLMLERLRASDNVRFCVWPGQSDDGKKWSANLANGSQAFPWDGASDTRVPLADSIVNDLVDILGTAHTRAQVRVAPVENSDAGAAAAATTLMRWLSDHNVQAFGREAEMVAQHMLAYGHAVAFVGWDQKSGLRTQKLKMDDIIAMAQSPEAQGVLAQFPAMVVNESMTDQAADILMGYVTGLRRGKARQIVKDLRTTGEAEFPQQYICKNEPVILALKPWEDVSFPPETVDLQRARVIFRRQFMTEVEVRAKVVDEGWDEGWVDAVISTAGRTTNWMDMSGGSSPISGWFDRRDNLIDVVWAYTRQLDADGVPGIYYTVFSPLTGRGGDAPEYGKHELLDYAHGDYPFVLFKREHVARRVEESRGVPEVCLTWQQEIKAQRDSVFDATSFETLPPIQVAKRLGLASKIGPAVQLSVTRPGDYEFMKPPARQPGTAFQLIESVSRMADAYFGRANELVPVAQTQLKQQRMVNEWLRCWSSVYEQMFRLCIQYYTPEEMSRIVGVADAAGFSADAAKFDFQLRFNVAELDTDLVKERLTTISSAIVPLDVSGRIDRAKLVEHILRAVSPENANDLLVDQATASQAMYNGVKQDIAQMMLGIEATYMDASNDPSSGMKLQYTQEVVSANPKATQALQGDQLFAELMKKYVQNLQMGVSQQQNKQVGRIGVKPMQGAQQ